MPRIARVVAPGLPHHVTQRGNRRAQVFLDADDRKAYLDFLTQYRTKHGLEVLAYCLISNHIHLVAVPAQTHSLARTLADTHMRYAQHFNRKYSESGHLWQGRFFSCTLDEPHMLAAARYVERNPVRAGLTGRPDDYRWSSAGGHLGEMSDPILAKGWPPKELLSQWREMLLDADEEGLEQIRMTTRTGRPLGGLPFIDKLGRKLGRDLQRKTAGRPRKTNDKKGLQRKNRALSP